MAKKITKASVQKILNEMIEVFKKHNVCQNVSFVIKGKRISFGEADIDWEATHKAEEAGDDMTLIFKEVPMRIKESADILPDKWSGNNGTILVQYDGGLFYSMWTGEYGYNTKEKIDQELEKVLGPYHLGIEEVDNVSFTLYEGYVPDYETVANKLARC